MQKTTVDRAALRFAAAGGDVAAAIAALFVARALRRRITLPLMLGLLPRENFPISPALIVLVVSVQLVALSAFGLNGARGRVAKELGRRLSAVMLTELGLLATILVFVPSLVFPRSVIPIYLVVDGTLLFLHRRLIRRSASGERSRTLIVAAGPEARLLVEAIARAPWAGIDVAAVVQPPGSRPAEIPTLEGEDELLRLISETGSDHVLFAPDASGFRDRSIEHLTLQGKAFLWTLPSPYETLIGRLRFRPLGELPLLEIRARGPQGAAAVAKRVVDVAAAAVGLAAASPVLGAAMAAVRLVSGAPIFFAQARVGRGGEVFRLWKLRTMSLGAEEQTGAVLASAADPRVTGVGRFLRTCRIDEIPQLWNVLKGEMSLVGPRPERPEFVRVFDREIPGYGLRHSVRPGLTGLAQISGEYLTPAAIKLRYDLAYINNWSLLLDATILARTLPVVLTRRGV